MKENNILFNVKSFLPLNLSIVEPHSQLPVRIGIVMEASLPELSFSDKITHVS
jgi:hypothetical protein